MDCSCGLLDVQRYQSKLSGPLLDRIDMILEIPREHIDQLLGPIEAQSSAELREQVLSAWRIQQKRFAQEPFENNASIDAKSLHRYVVL